MFSFLYQVHVTHTVIWHFRTNHFALYQISVIVITSSNLYLKQHDLLVLHGIALCCFHTNINSLNCCNHASQQDARHLQSQFHTLAIMITHVLSTNLKYFLHLPSCCCPFGGEKNHLNRSWDLCSPGILCTFGWNLVTDVSDGLLVPTPRFKQSNTNTRRWKHPLYTAWCVGGDWIINLTTYFHLMLKELSPHTVPYLLGTWAFFIFRTKAVQV
jgi:hypothetical protein